MNLRNLISRKIDFLETVFILVVVRQVIIGPIFALIFDYKLSFPTYFFLLNLFILPFLKLK